MDEWFVKVQERRRQEFDKTVGKPQTTPGGYTMHEEDHEVPDNLSEEGTLFLLASMGVQGVPLPNGNGKGK